MLVLGFPQAEAARPPGWIPCHINRSSITLSCQINGSAQLAFLDTGSLWGSASAKVLDGAPEGSEGRRVASFKIGPVTIPKAEWEVEDNKLLEDLSGTQRNPISGLVGLNLLQHQILAIDYAEEKVAFLSTKEEAKHLITAKLKCRFAMEVSNDGFLFVRGRVGSRTIRMLVDTGTGIWSFKSLPSGDVRDALPDMPIATANGIQKKKQRLVESLQFGGVKIPLVVGSEMYSGEDMDGTTNPYFLAQRWAVLDLKSLELLTDGPPGPYRVVQELLTTLTTIQFELDDTGLRVSPRYQDLALRGLKVISLAGIPSHAFLAAANLRRPQLREWCLGLAKKMERHSSMVVVSMGHNKVVPLPRFAD